VAEYRTVAGFVQFDPNVREVNGKNIQDALIQNISKNLDIRVSVWPEQQVGDIEKGDFLVAQGKYEEREAKGKTYRNLTASKLRLFKAQEPQGVTVVNPVSDEPAADVEPDDEPF
jgi:hypothetical protein